MIASIDRIEGVLTRERRGPGLTPEASFVGHQTSFMCPLRGVAMAVAVASVFLGSGGTAQADNRIAVENHLNQIAATGGVPAELAQLLTDLGAPGPVSASDEVVRALSPEAYDAHTTVVVESGRLIANQLLDRLRECKEDELEPWVGRKEPLRCNSHQLTPWVAAIGSFRKRDSFGSHPEYDAQLGGLVAGIDARPAPGIDVALAVSWQHGSIEIENSKSTVTFTDLTGHVSWTKGPVRAQAVLGWGHGFHQDRRTIRFFDSVTPVSVRGKDDHESDRISVVGEVGVEFVAGPFQVEPTFGVDWAWVYQRGISEDGAGAFGIRIPNRDDEVGSVTVGLRASTVVHNSGRGGSLYSWMEGVWRPQVDARWRQIVEGDEREIEGRLRGAPSSVSDFTIKGKEDDGGVELSGGLSFVPEKANRLRFEIRYEIFVASNTLQQNVTARVALGF